MASPLMIAQEFGIDQVAHERSLEKSALIAFNEIEKKLHRKLWLSTESEWNTALSKKDQPTLYFDHPHAIIENRSIKTLCLSFCNLTEIPLAVLKLRELISLLLDNNEISTLPPDLNALQKLQLISLERNPLSEWPQVLENLPLLRSLNLNDTKIQKIPDHVHGCANLEEIQLMGLGLDHIPEWIVQLPQLSILDMESNDITEIPPKLFQNPKQLRKLNFAFNKLTSFPVEGVFTKCEVNIDENPISNLRNWKELDWLRTQKGRNEARKRYMNFPAHIAERIRSNTPLDAIDRWHPEWLKFEPFWEPLLKEFANDTAKAVRAELERRKTAAGLKRGDLDLVI